MVRDKVGEAVWKHLYINEHWRTLATDEKYNYGNSTGLKP